MDGLILIRPATREVEEISTLSEKLVELLDGIKAQNDWTQGYQSDG